MVEVKVLPTQEPDQKLTARHRIKTLSEHQLAFLNANNLSGFMEDQDYVLDENKVGDILVMIATSERIKRHQFPAYVKMIRKASACGGVELPKNVGRELVARALGYDMNWFEFAKLISKLSDIPNRLANINEAKIFTRTDARMKLLEDKRVIFNDFLRRMESGDPPECEVEVKLLEFKRCPSVSLADAKKFALDIKNSHGIGLGLAYNLVARCLGYDAWSEAKAAEIDGIICRRS